MRIRAAGQSLVAALLCCLLWTAASASAREDAEQRAMQLNQQARQLWTEGHYPQALPLAQQALELSEKALGPDHAQTASSLDNLGNILSKTGVYAKAETMFRRVLTIREKTLKPDDAQIASALSNLAALYDTLGDYARTEPLLRRALAIREKVFGSDHEQTATSFDDLGCLYVHIGDYARAEPLHQRALEIRERIFGPNHPQTATALSHLGTVYYYTAAYAQAEAADLRALDIYEKAYGQEHLDTARVLNNLGTVYVAMQAYPRALSMYQRALSIREKALGTQDIQVSGTLNNLAGLHRMLGEVDQALPLYLRALAINEQRLGLLHPLTANSLNNLGNLYFDTGDYAKAESVYARALSIREKILSPRHPDVLQSLTNLALNGWALGQHSRALTMFQRAQAIQLKNSEQFLFSGSESRRRAYVESYAEDTYARVSFSLAMSPANMPLSRGALELSLDSVLQYKGRVLETTSDNVARLRRSISGEDRVLMDRLARIANQSSKVLYQGLGDSSPERRNLRLSELTRQQDALEAQLAKRSSEFREQTQMVTVASVRRAIPKEAALVEWIRYKPFDPKASNVDAQWGPPRYAAYVLTALDAPTVVDLGEAAELDRLATEFNVAISDPKRSDVSQRASALSKKLIEPLLPQLRDRSRWLLSPDGALNLVSMAALLDSDGRYLAENFEITYLSSGRDLLRLASAAPRTSTQAVLVADPDYGALPAPAQAIALAQARQSDLGGGGLMFKPLPGTALEAQSLQKLLEPRAAEVLMHGNATEEQLRALHGPRLLHIATHGFFLSDQAVKTTESGAAFATSNHNPLLRAGIALAGANTRRSGASDDGILTAQEMAQLDLRGTELVVLSACETAAGEAAGGEGVYGMRRALVLAGAQAQVTSLWQVSDQATRLLMVNFYRRLLQGDGRSAALRAAQRDMMADPTRRHPYYWAGFVPVGDWRPLTQRH